MLKKSEIFSSEIILRMRQDHGHQTFEIEVSRKDNIFTRDRTSTSDRMLRVQILVQYKEVRAIQI